MLKHSSDSGPSQHTLYGVLSGGELGIDRWVRVDRAVVRSWIDAAVSAPLADTPPPATTSDKSSSDCGGLTFAGSCEGDDLSYCDNGQVEVIACGDFGGTCAEVSPGEFDCQYTDAAMGDPCEGVTFEGECDGDVLRFCDGQVHVVDCALHDASCAWNEGEQYFDCL